ncbi:hypothetical protein SNARM312S_03306 [Streptomyces narbonensis]
MRGVRGARDVRHWGNGGRAGKLGGMRSTTRDISDRDDLDVILRRFYTAAFADPLIGPFFTEIAGTDLEVHLPRITDFWERALFRTADYGRDAFAPHAALHSARPLTAAHFGRWTQLWRATVDGLHQGPRAERAKAQGERIAVACCGGWPGRTRRPRAEAAGDSSPWRRSSCARWPDRRNLRRISRESDEFRAGRPSYLSQRRNAPSTPAARWKRARHGPADHLRQPAREGPRRQQGLLREDRLLHQPELHRRDRVRVVISDTIFAMLLTEEKFRSFTAPGKTISDATKTTEVLITLSAESRAKADELADAALAAGGSPAKEPMDMGFMYGRSFADPDGHHSAGFWMDPAAAQG